MADEAPDLVKITTKNQGKGYAPRVNVELPEKVRASSIGKKNAFKHGRYAKLMTAHCDSCYLRAEEAGGSGQCSEYEPEAVCSIDKDLKKVIDQYDTRNEDDIKEILNDTAKDLLLRVKKSVIQAMMDGNFIDKTYLSNQNALMNTLRMANDLNRQMRVEATQTETYSQKGELASVMKTLRTEFMESKGND